MKGEKGRAGDWENLRRRLALGVGWGWVVVAGDGPEGKHGEGEEEDAAPGVGAGDEAVAPAEPADEEVAGPDGEHDDELAGADTAGLAEPVEHTKNDGNAERPDADDEELAVKRVELGEGREQAEDAGEAFLFEAVALDKIHEGGDGEEAEDPVAEDGEGDVEFDPGVAGVGEAGGWEIRAGEEEGGDAEQGGETGGEEAEEAEAEGGAQDQLEKHRHPGEGLEEFEGVADGEGVGGEAAQVEADGLGSETGDDEDVKDRAVVLAAPHGDGQGVAEAEDVEGDGGLKQMQGSVSGHDGRDWAKRERIGSTGRLLKRQSAFEKRDETVFDGRIMPTWNSEQYLKFAAERTQPAVDLAARVRVEAPGRVMDLGCGPGNSTAVLAQRWPGAELTGLDSSPAMIAAAKKDYPHGNWVGGDIGNWAADRAYDVVFSNAALQWVPDHARVLPRLLAQVREGGALAMQVPANMDAPAHALMRDVGAMATWRRYFGKPVREWFVEAVERYYDIMAPHAGRVDLWVTEYQHVMEGPEALVEWYRGTGLRPWLDALPDEETRKRFEADYLAAIRPAYPPRGDGRVLFPFRRLFLVAYR